MGEKPKTFLEDLVKKMNGVRKRELASYALDPKENLLKHGLVLFCLCRPNPIM